MAGQFFGFKQASGFSRLRLRSVRLGPRFGPSRQRVGMDADATNDSAAASASCIQRGWVLTGGFLNLPLGIPAVEVPVPNSQESRVFVSLRTTHRGLARWASNRPLNENVLAGSATFQAIREAAWQAVLSASARPANAKAEGEDPAAELGLELRKRKPITSARPP